MNFLTKTAILESTMWVKKVSEAKASATTSSPRGSLPFSWMRAPPTSQSDVTVCHDGHGGQAHGALDSARVFARKHGKKVVTAFIAGGLVGLGIRRCSSKCSHNDSDAAAETKGKE